MKLYINHGLKAVKCKTERILIIKPNSLKADRTIIFLKTYTKFALKPTINKVKSGYK
jgi:hypothetical protein